MNWMGTPAAEAHTASVARADVTPGEVTRREVTRGDRGSAVAEFSLVLVPLVLLVVCVLQVATFLHVRNVLAASAAEGARFAANADVPAVAGGPRAEEIAGSALPASVLGGIECAGAERVTDEGLGVVAVHCRGALPTVVAALGDVLPVDVTGRAIAEGQ